MGGRIHKKAIEKAITKGKRVIHITQKIKRKEILDSTLLRTSGKFIGILLPKKSLESHKISGRVLKRISLNF